jgi:galactokinase
MTYLSDTFELTQPDRATLVYDLRVAATQFDDDAARATTAGMTGAASVLMRQAAEARAIADRLSDARYVRIGRAKLIPEA